MHMLIGSLFLVVFGILSYILSAGTIHLFRLILSTKAIQDAMQSNDKMLLHGSKCKAQGVQWKY